MVADFNKLDLNGNKSPVVARKNRSVYVERGTLDDFVRFLTERLGSEATVFRGGYVFGCLTGEHRYTKDVDLDLYNKSSYEQVKEVLREYGEQLVAQGKCSSYKIADEATVERSGGVVYYCESENGITGKLFSADINVTASQLVSTKVDIPGVGEVQAVTVEQALADKLSVLFSRQLQRRIKDLLDVYFISRACTVDWNIVRNILDDSGHWPLNLEYSPFREDMFDKLEHAYERFRLLDLNTFSEREKPEFFSLLLAVSKFMAPLLAETGVFL